MEEPFSQRGSAFWREDLITAAAFLTRLPLRAPPPLPGALARASWVFPVIGAGIGIVGGLAYVVAASLGLPVLAAALIAIGATVLLTGGLHEDGLADTADGFGGGAQREAKLAIMRDSRSGAFGVLALIFSVLLRVAALAAIGGGGAVLATLVAAHAAARGALPLVLRALDPARADGLGFAAGRPESAVAWGAGGIGVVIAVLALGLVPGVVALIVSGLVVAGLANLARRQIGGYTGDVLGAIEQGGEIVMILAASAWAS